MNKPWFGKRRYGYGWGMPQTWQGWVTLVVWMLLVLATTKMLPKDKTVPFSKSLPWFGVLMVLISILIVICYKTSGKPQWQWGKDDEK